MVNTKYQFTIESGKLDRNYWVDIWRYRELFYILAWRDIAVRYKQTIFGVLWAILRPVITMTVFVMVFEKIAKLPSEGVPYPIYVFTAMLPWTFFATAFSDASNSFVNNANLISKIYFPRLIIPVASVVVAAVDFMISFVILLGLMIWYQYWPSWQIIFLPLFFILVILTSLGLGILLASLNIKYRDFRFLIPFIVQFGLYISPVGFSASVVPEVYRIIYQLNPMVAIINGFRWSISGGKTYFNTHELLVSINVILLLFLLGIFYFRKAEKYFSDVI